MQRTVFVGGKKASELDAPAQAGWRLPVSLITPVSGRRQNRPDYVCSIGRRRHVARRRLEDAINKYVCPSTAHVKPRGGDES